MHSRYRDKIELAASGAKTLRWRVLFALMVVAWTHPGFCADKTGSDLLELIQLGALTGNLQAASEFVKAMDEHAEDAVTQVLAQQYRDRFLGAKEQSGEQGPELLANELAHESAAIYRNYWRKSLTSTQNQQQAREQLRLQLASLLSDTYTQFDASESVTGQLERALEREGLGVSAGDTPPFLDLYIWDRQSEAKLQVELTDRVETVNVTFIPEPLVQGWQHYASLGLAATSGWATAEGLYCLCWSYDLDSEAFEVSWLKHETRHLVDFREFPSLPEVQMEYRAKLTELAFTGNQVSTLLRQFANNSAENSESAHAVANFRVSRDIYREVFQREMPVYLDPWQLLGPERVNPAARRLLKRDSEILRLEAEAAVAP
jgi:hypothetical protein